MWEISEDADTGNTGGNRINPYYRALFMNGTREEQLKELERMRSDPRYLGPSTEQELERPPAAVALLPRWR